MLISLPWKLLVSHIITLITNHTNHNTNHEIEIRFTCARKCDPSAAACRAEGREGWRPGPRPGVRWQAVCTPASAPDCSEAECSDLANYLDGTNLTIENFIDFSNFLKRAYDTDQAKEGHHNCLHNDPETELRDICHLDVPADSDLWSE